MKDLNKFAVFLMMVGLGFIIFSFYHWSYFFGDFAKVEDPSQFWMGIAIGFGSLIYGFDKLKIKIKEEEQKKYEGKHFEQHQEIVNRLSRLRYFGD